MRHLNISWKIMNDKAEPANFRTDAEAEVREHALIGMYPAGPKSKGIVLGACQRVRRELGVQIGPQPVRFTEKELRLMIAAVENIEFGDQAEILGISNKLRHREKTMRSARNRDQRKT